MLKGKQEERVSSASAFTSTWGLVDAAPPGQNAPRGLRRARTPDEQLWPRALAFGRSAHCQRETLAPGRGLSCAETKQVCGVTGGASGGRNNTTGAAQPALCELLSQMPCARR